jgi:hypothetical protein
MRWGAFIIPLLLLPGLIFNLIRWKRNGSRFGFISGFLPNLRLVLTLGLSLFLLFAVTRTFQMFISNSIRYQPDIGWGLVMIAVLGVISGFARYFGTIRD